MNTSELLVKVAEENQTRKILELLNESRDLEDAKEKIKALLSKQGLTRTERAVDLPKPPQLQDTLYTIGQEKGRG